jgi:LiaI-LiaF-like transmembrane region
MNMTDESRRHRKVVFLPPTAFQGVLVIAFGVVLLLSQLGVLPPFKVAQLWPSLLIVAGLAIAFRSALADDRIVGGFLAAVGVLFSMMNGGMTTSSGPGSGHYCLFSWGLS